MNTKKRSISLLMTALVLLSALTLPSAAFRNGDVVDAVLHTDIVTYINGKPIESYNIKGYTAIKVEDLSSYGFDVEWNGRDRTLSVNRVVDFAIFGNYTIVPNTYPVGSYWMDVYYTDIKTYFEGKEVPSYNIGGSTIAYVDDLAKYYAAPDKYIWDGAARTLSLTLWGDSPIGSWTDTVDPSPEPSPSPAPAPDPAPTAEPLRIVSHPQSVAVNTLNQMLSFTVAIKGGTPGYTYVWQKSVDGSNWSDLSAPSNQTLSYPATESDLSSSYYIRVIVKDSAGQSVTSGSAAVLGVLRNQQPSAPLSVKVDCTASGDTAVWKATPSGGSGGYKYQWQTQTLYVGGKWYWEDFAGETAQTLAVNTSGKTGTWNFRCVVIDSSGMTAYAEASYTKEQNQSPLKDLTIYGPSSATAGQTVAFNAAVTGGNKPYTFIWQYLKPNDSWKVASATGDSLTMTPDSAGSWKVYCMVTDASGDSITSNTLTVNVAAPSSSSSSPSSSAVSKTASISATAGKAVNTKLNFSDYGMPSTMSVTLDPNTAYNNLSDYGLSCGFSNSYAQITGTPTKAGTAKCRIVGTSSGTTYNFDIKIVISAAPTSTLPSVAVFHVNSQYVYVGGSGQIKALVSGGRPPYTYKWVGKSDNVAGLTFQTQTTDTLTISYIYEDEFTSHWKYQCIVTDADGYTTSSNWISFQKAASSELSVNVYPITPTAKKGEKVVFYVSVTGGKAPYKYQWQTMYKGNGYVFQDLVGEIDPTMTVIADPIERTSDYKYRCVVTDADGKTEASYTVFIYSITD